MKHFFIPALFLLVLAGCGSNETKQETAASEVEAAPQEVNVYTHRYYDTDKQLFEQFETETGIKVNVKKDGADKLIALLQSEGENTAADLLMTVDVGRLHYAKEIGLLQSKTSETLQKQIPATLRDADNQWHGLTTRARVVMYSTERVDPNTLSTYEDLADPKWKGKISIRSSSNIYNRSLLASIIAHNGEEGALAWAQGVVGNMFQPPKGNDRDQIKNVALGKADLAVANTYYLGKLLNSDNELEQEAGAQVSVFFPNQEGRGAHINVSGAGVTKHAKNADNAVRLLEFLSSPAAQRVLSDSNYEYPVNPEVEPAELLKSWGDFKADELSLTQLGELHSSAVTVFENAGWK